MIATQRERPPFLDFLGKALDIVLEPKTPFLTAPVMDILFNGLPINCDHDEFEAQVSRLWMNCIVNFDWNFSWLGTLHGLTGRRKGNKSY
jgi:hypothetical protein